MKIHVTAEANGGQDERIIADRLIYTNGDTVMLLGEHDFPIVPRAGDEILIRVPERALKPTWYRREVWADRLGKVTSVTHRSAAASKRFRLFRTPQGKVDLRVHLYPGKGD